MQTIQGSTAYPPTLPPDSGAMPAGDAGFGSMLARLPGGLPSQPSSETSPGTSSADASAATSSGTSDPGEPSIDSTQSSKDIAAWSPLVQGLPPGQQQAAATALNRPIAVAQMLLSGTPEQKKAAQAYLDKNPALKKALDTAAHGGKGDGNISTHDLEAFIGKMHGQLSRADNTVKQYEKNNPNADAQSLQLVRQSALLQANLPLTSANSPDKDGKTGKETTRDGLLAVAQDSGLSSALRGAASTFSQPGMFQVLDQGGKQGHDLATHNADGKFDEGNIIGWVKKQAPTTGGQFASLVSDAATRNAVAGVDTSKLNQDVFANPQNYSGAQKAAVLVQLQTTQQQLQAGSDLKHNDKTDDEIGKDIETLSSDPSVQQYLARSVPQGERAIVGSDSSLSRAVQTTYRSDVLTGGQLQGDLDAVSKNNADKKSAKQTDASALSDFQSQVQLDSDLTGGRSPSAQQIVASQSGLTTELEQDYVSDFSQGGELQMLQSQKNAKLADSLGTTQGDEQAFESVLDPQFVQGQASGYQQSTAAIAGADGGSGKAVMSALQGGGKADASDIAASIAETDPAQLYGGATTGLTQQDTQALVTSFLKDLDSGASLQDACAKFNPESGTFDPHACDGTVMSKLANPQTAQAVQGLLQNLAYGALGMQSPLAPQSAGPAQASGADAAAGAGSASAGAQGAPAETASAQQKALEGLQYASFGMGGLAMAGGWAANGINARRDASDADKARAGTRIGGATDGLGGLAGVFGAASMLPGISQEIRNGQGGQAALSIAGSARGIVQGTGLVANVGDMAARRAGLASGEISSYALRRSGSLGLAAESATKEVGGEWAGNALSRAAGSIAGRVGGMAAAEAIGAAAGPVGVVVDVALGLGFGIEAIVEAIKRAHEKKEMQHTVNPTLQQYGIATV